MFKIPDNKNIGKLFSKYELLFLDQANFSSNPSQILILQFPIRRASLPSSLSLSNFTLANWNPLQHNLHLVLHRFSYFVLPHSITSYHKYWIYQTICKAKPIKFIIKLYTNHDTLSVKHATHQKAKSLRASSVSNLDNMLNNNSTFNTKYAEFSTKWQVLLHFHNPTCAYNQCYNLHQKTVPLLQSIFTSLFHPYLFTKSSLRSPLTLPSSLP